MTATEKFQQFNEIANSIGPISDPVKEIYVFVSRKDGLEGMMSFSLTDNPPVNLQSCTSDKGSVEWIEEKIKEQVKLPEGCTVHLCRFVLAEEIKQVL